ncbi:HWE histidine kinase domain-containing protein [Rhodospirillaceae bacterium SYSU D60014]|uniref:sensor histidine kinase n=1 Tax=Virgifigura deserti TaxID=2268457 RepID=UPI0013C410AF
MRTDNLDALLQEATALVSEAIEVELVKVLELLPDGEAMLVRAGVNWKPGVVGHATLGAHERSPGGYALQQDQAVISRDVATEERFEIPALLVDHGVKSMVNVVIRGEREAFGVLEVDSRRHRDFDEDDISFLQNYANLLAFAVDRLASHRELAEAEETGRILLRELQHRVKNLLANIRALARRIRAESISLDEFGAAFDSRLGALARTQDLLTCGPGGAADIRDILRQELAAHGAREGERLTLQGPRAMLQSNMAQALGMAFHELATNAVKYGALGGEDGRIDISWTVEPSDGGTRMLIRWREHGIEIKGDPSRRGLGSEVIEETVPYMLGGTSALMFHPDGVECTIRFPVPKGSASA